MPDPNRPAYQTAELSPFGPVATYGRIPQMPPLVLRRHVASGAPCARTHCENRHHYPKHRRTGPQNDEPTTYVGRHAAGVYAPKHRGA